MVFVECDNFIHRFFWSVAPALALTDFLKISAFIFDKIENVQHGGQVWAGVGLDLKNIDALVKFVRLELRG